MRLAVGATEDGRKVERGMSLEGRVNVGPARHISDLCESSGYSLGFVSFLGLIELSSGPVERRAVGIFN
jgi:hypothetical protein